MGVPKVSKAPLLLGDEDEHDVGVETTKTAG
jgi:hypothetical protein